MQIPCCALTAKKPGTGEHHPAFIHPCVRPHYATNLEARATLHDYHLDGNEVNVHSGAVQCEREGDHGLARSPAGKT
jgi:hypothetical protein